jgi:hypothetical protein
VTSPGGRESGDFSGVHWAECALVLNSGGMGSGDRGSVAFLAAVALVAACGGESSNSGAAGTGGSSGDATGGMPTGGASGAGGAGGAGAAGGFGGSAGNGGAGTGGAGDGGSSGAGTGGTGGLPSDWAKCLTDLVARCPLVGSCVESEADGVTRTCYADGARTESEELPSMSCPPGRVERVYGNDGSLCYTSTMTSGPGCENPSTNWVDADGNSVAVSSGPNAFAPTLYSFTCIDGVTFRFEAPPPLSVPARPICEPGVCPDGEGGMGGAQ